MNTHDKQKKQKKSQAALEFLTTYAWAFVVIGIVIAAIAYFGILKPQKVLPDRCTFNVGFGCQAYSLENGVAAADDTIRLRLKNGVGYAVTVTGINLTTEAGVVFGSLPPFCTTATPALPASWGSGVVQDFTWTGCDLAVVGFTDGEKAKAFVKLDYYDPQAGTNYRKVAEGEIFTTVT